MSIFFKNLANVSLLLQRQVSVWVVITVTSMIAVPPAYAWPGGIGGSFKGIIPDTGNVVCKNLTTSETVNIPITPDAGIWDCKEAGLVVNPTDQIKMTINVQGPLKSGLDADSAAESCQAIHKRFPNLLTDVYWVSKGAFPPVQVFCDMATAGGGWQVLFRGDDPSQWSKTFGTPGTGKWGVDKTGVPSTIRQLRFTRVATGAALTIPITADKIYSCSAVNSTYFWNGTNIDAYNGLHLGITNNVSIVKTGYVYVGSPCAHYNHGWGFGHRGWQDDHQGWGWNSKDLGPTVFMISVR